MNRIEQLKRINSQEPVRVGELLAALQELETVKKARDTAVECEQAGRVENNRLRDQLDKLKKENDRLFTGWQALKVERDEVKLDCNERTRLHLKAVAERDEFKQEIEAIKNSLAGFHGGLPNDDAVEGIQYLYKAITEVRQERNDLRRLLDQCRESHDKREREIAVLKRESRNLNSTARK